MKHLRQYIRQLLLTESINPKIAKQIDKLKSLDGFIDIKSSGKQANTIDVGVMVFNEQHFNPEFGRVFALHKGAAGNCNGAMIVGGDGWGEGTYAREGLGPLLYDVALEGVTFIDKTGLGPDHTSVSDSAASLWGYYLNNRPDVIVKQRDITQAPRTPEEIDDCTSDDGFRAAAQRFPGGAEAAYGTEPSYAPGDTEKHFPRNPTASFSKEFLDYWFDPTNSLSKTYHKEGTPVINSLRSEYRLFPAGAIFIGQPYSQEEMQQVWDKSYGTAYPKNHVKVPWISNIWKRIYGFDTSLLQELNPDAEWEKYK